MTKDVLDGFGVATREWFRAAFAAPTDAQAGAWRAIGAGRNALVVAPTGSGKTLAAFLWSLDRLASAPAPEDPRHRCRVLYVSPLKALAVDVERNLRAPLTGIRQAAARLGLAPPDVTVGMRTGDTPADERRAFGRTPPDILITTPESLFLLLTSAARESLRGVETVIVDEVHAVAATKRGAHLALSLERLDALLPRPAQRVGLSATVRPIDDTARFLGGAHAVEIVQPRSAKTIEVSVQVPVEDMTRLDEVSDEPADELGGARRASIWPAVEERVLDLIEAHRSTIVFTNSRRGAERLCARINELAVERVTSPEPVDPGRPPPRMPAEVMAQAGGAAGAAPVVARAHHGSVSREERKHIEEALKSGHLPAVVATSSLELGIDMGAVDLVVQIEAPPSVSAGLQRVGRAGHQVGAVSRGVVFPKHRGDLLSCAVVAERMGEGAIEELRYPRNPLDVLAQQIVAMVALDAWQVDDLAALVRRAAPFAELPESALRAVLDMLSGRYPSTAFAELRPRLVWDRTTDVLTGSRGAQRLAVTSGGTIPDRGMFGVFLAGAERAARVGELDEEMVYESRVGDVFLLGSTSWRIQSVRGGQVRVENANGAPPSVPFWLGEAPARTIELSHEVARFRDDVLHGGDPVGLISKLKMPPHAAELLVRYLRATEKMLGAIPTTQTVVAERFFDEAGGMQLVIHAPFGGRVNRAWGMALRKRFCRTFDFELQAAANDDALLLSLGEQHSFPLAEIFDFLHPDHVEEVLTQAILQAPLFGTRFRWNATRALALSRFSMGKKVPPQLQRARSDDLLAAVFPAQVGCQDNHGGGDIELPDHPLVKETMENCLREAMDVDGLKEVLRGIRSGAIRTVAADLPEPSPLAHHILNSAPYTYLDEAPLEERRARAVSLRRTLPPEDAAAFGALDGNAIAQVVSDAAPLIRDAEELHDALLQFVLLSDAAVKPELSRPLVETRRAASFEVEGARFWTAAERIPHVQALFPGVVLSPPLSPLPGDGPVEREAAVVSAVRGRLEVCGPTTSAELAEQLRLPEGDVTIALFKLESEGQVLRGTFRPGSAGKQEWCDRRLLQRIHRLTVGRLRQEVEPLTSQDFMRFLFRWHHFDDPLRGQGGLLKAIGLLQGYEAPAASWELVLLPSRMKGYQPELLERCAYAGELAWGRLTPREQKALPGPKRGMPDALAEEKAIVRKAATPGRNANLTFVRREELDWMLCAARPGAVLADGGVALPPELTHAARDVVAALERRGACFFQDLVSMSKRLPAEVEDALWELLAHGLVTADAVDNLRVLQSPKARKRQKALRRGGPGRWSLLVPSEPKPADEILERVAKLFLTRYGIVWRDLVLREPLAPSWRELLFVYRRMEARGEIRGGRFLAGFAGEQFALPEAVDMARAVRRTKPNGQTFYVSAVDPLNLTGIVTPGPRIPAMLGNVVTYVDGVPRYESDEKADGGSESQSDAA